MKCLLVMMTAVAAVTISGQECSADVSPSGLYVGLGTGWSMIDGTADFDGFPRRPLSYQGNARLSGVLGYKWNDGWRVEADPTWATNDADIVGLKGGTTIAGGMLDSLYDYALGDRWKFTGGVGIGAVRISHDIKSVATGGLFLGGNGINFAWQLIAGVSYTLRYNLDVGVDYHYLDAGNTDAVSRYASVAYGAGEAHTVLLGHRWYPFANQEATSPLPAPASLPPTPASPPPPSPPRPPAPDTPLPAKTYIVFFGFDKSAVTVEAKRTIAEAIAAARTLGYVRIKVTGHTDAAGSDRYNQILSLRRAQSVKDEMVRHGIAEDQIGIEGRSFHDPLVPTEPGVREPKNRRALIDLGQ